MKLMLFEHEADQGGHTLWNSRQLLKSLPCGGGAEQ